MLIDHAVICERWAKLRAVRADLPEAFGDFLAGLADWSWFVNPITYRGDAPSSDAAMNGIREWLADVQASTRGNQVGWVIAEEFGAFGGRWHCHGLICGVSHLRRRFWWAEAFRRFGRTRIEPFDPTRAGTFYAAKYAAKALGKIHFGGVLAGVELSRTVEVEEHSARCLLLPRLYPDVRARRCKAHSERAVKRVWTDAEVRSSEPVATHAVAVPSAELGRDFFRLGLLRRWHR